MFLKKKDKRKLFYFIPVNLKISVQHMNLQKSITQLSQEEIENMKMTII